MGTNWSLCIYFWISKNKTRRQILLTCRKILLIKLVKLVMVLLLVVDLELWKPETKVHIMVVELLLV